jgi:hypothetical protein
MVKPYGEPGIRLWISAHGENLEISKKGLRRLLNY